MMGFLQRIREWFRNRSTATSPAPEDVQTIVKPLHQVERPDDAIGALIWEHERLDSERSTLREEMVQVDSRYAGGELAPGDRDRAYRLCLARAGRISLRQMEIRQQLVQLGYDVPSNWGVVRRI